MTQREIDKILYRHRLWLAQDVRGARAGLSNADLRYVDLSNADLRGANLEDADLRDADLSNTNLRFADLNDADLRDANLSKADLSNANLSGTNLSGVEGLVSSIDYMKANFERTADGYIVYKCFNSSHKAPVKWKIKSGEVLEEEVNSNRTDRCGCGINVAPLKQIKREYPRSKIYKLLIRWEWLPGVIVPYNTDGKIRCAKAMIIDEV